MTERLHFHFSRSCIGEGNGNPLQCSCMENPRDGEAWWAAVYGVAQSQTRLKRLSSSNSTRIWSQARQGLQDPSSLTRLWCLLSNLGSYICTQNDLSVSDHSCHSSTSSGTWAHSVDNYGTPSNTPKNQPRKTSKWLLSSICLSYVRNQRSQLKSASCTIYTKYLH